MGNKGRDYYRQDRPRTPGVMMVMRKNGEDYVVDFGCAESRRLLHNLTDMRWKVSACIDLRMAMVPESYHRT
jgi:hypothetical protein